MVANECPHCKRKVANETQQGYVLNTKLEEDGSLISVLYNYSMKLVSKNGDYQYEVEKIDLKGAIYATEKSIYFYKSEDGKELKKQLVVK